MAAFRVSSLCPSGPIRKEGSEPIDESLRLKRRAVTMETLSPAQLRGWRGQPLRSPRRRAAVDLPTCSVLRRRPLREQQP